MKKNDDIIVLLEQGKSESNVQAGLENNMDLKNWKTSKPERRDILKTSESEEPIEHNIVFIKPRIVRNTDMKIAIAMRQT